MLHANYAYVKTAEGDEIQGLDKEDFENAIDELECKKLERSDRTLYIVEEEDTVDDINYFAFDYIEKIKD